MLQKINDFVWGAPALIGILGTGLYLSVKTGFVQLRLFPKALRLFFGKMKASKPGQVSSFQALCTALAATVGTGNLVGVAGAIAIGGPGALFWMWVSGVVGMVTKFSEAVLAILYRQKAGAGYVGGPMYIIRNGLGKRWQPMAGFYAFLGVVAALGVGNATQINTVIGGVADAVGYFGGEFTRKAELIAGVVLAAVVGIVLMGGAGRIAAAAERLVPVAAGGYIALCLVVLAGNFRQIPGAFAAVFAGAFCPEAATGGLVGSMLKAMRIGVSRGVFTNEAGMGTAAIAHAAAEVEHPVEQGLMGSMEVFIDTLVICTLTGLVILCSGIPIPYGSDAGIHLTNQAFSQAAGGWTAVPIALFLCCFAFATVLGWGLYGGICLRYLLGDRAWRPYVWAQMVTVVISAVLDTQTVWLLAETVNGIMAIPNLLALVMLCPAVVSVVRDYKKISG